MSATNNILIGQALANAARQYPYRLVYRESGRDYGFAEHMAIVGGLVERLSTQFGIVSGDRVAVLANTSQAYVACWHAAMLGHFAIVPINVRLAPREIAALIGNAGASVLIHDIACAEAAAAAAHISEGKVTTVALSSLAHPSAAAALAPMAAEDDVVAIMYTGGTTGLPKGVTITQKALAVSAQRVHFLWDIFPADTCFYGTAALYHVSGNNLYLGPVLAGNLTILPSSFDIDLLVKDAREQKVTHLVLIAAMIDRFLAAIRDQPADYQNIRYIGYGGAPVSAATLVELSRLLPDTRIQQSYGMTEILGGATQLRSEDHVPARGKLVSAGRALPGCAIEARCADNSRCDAGEVGEIVVQIETVMPGYWQAPDKTAEVFDDGWYRTGDVGYVDAEGYLFLVDRLKDMIVTGGENVYSLEVERAIETIPGVRQACVIGIPSEIWGEQVHAFVVVNDKVALDADAIRHRLRALIGGYKIPKSFEIGTAPLPVTASNKVDKTTLRARFWRDAERMIN